MNRDDAATIPPQNGEYKSFGLDNFSYGRVVDGEEIYLSVDGEKIININDVLIKGYPFGKEFFQGHTSHRKSRPAAVFLPGLYLYRTLSAAPLYRAAESSRSESCRQMGHPAYHLKAFL